MKHLLMLIKLATFLFLMVITVACGRTVNWTEDVQLPDGRVVTLKRHQEFGGPHEIGQPPTESDYWLEFKHPDSGELIRWQSDRDLGTVALLLDHGAPRLIVVPQFGGSMKHNCPAPPYLLFQYQDHRWMEKSIEDIRGLKVRRNMIDSPTEAKELLAKSGAHLSAAQSMESASGYTDGHPIDFGKLTTQTFGIKGCDPPFDWMSGSLEGR